MLIYKKVCNIKKKNNLVVFITTSQSPHLEASIDYFQRYLNDYKEIYFINLLPCSKYRNEYTWRRYVDFKTNIVRKLRNSLLKKIYLKLFLFKNGFKKFSLENNYYLNVSSSDYFPILKTYTMTEFRTAALIPNKYENLIVNTISDTFFYVNNILKNINLNKSDTFLLFNGRHPIEYSIRYVLNKNGYKKITYHECNNHAPRVYFTDFQIHNLKKYHSYIQEYKNSNNFLLKRWQENKNLNIRRSQTKYVSFFTSSFDEYSFAYAKPINQSLLISNLLKFSNKIPLKIRVHPNTKNKSQQDMNYWNYLKKHFPDVIINYDEDASSYDLIKESFFTSSIGSSIAPESIMLGVNHLLCGNQHMYDGFNFFYKSTEENFINIILDMYKKRGLLRKISEEDKEFAAASQLFIRDIGHEIELAPLGRYPF